MPFSEKQIEYVRNANKRWNIKVGATRSGKTFCDFFMIPKRIRACSGNGIIVLLGNTKGTLSRNILEPMRSIWGDALVGTPSSDNSVNLFGKKCFLIGADKSSQVAKLQGVGIEYAYGDEITTWSEDVFNMLKSRLDKPNSVFDGTCNPASPNHWFKRFLDSDANIFLQSYTIDDNPFLPPSFVRELKKEYAGTVLYDRYILGRWCAAEGAVYPDFASDANSFLIYNSDPRLKKLDKITVGVDFGGTKSGTSFVAVASVDNYQYAVVLASERHTAAFDAAGLAQRFCNFCEKIASDWSFPHAVYCDSAESVLIRSLKSEAASRGLPIHIRCALKSSISERIKLTLRLMAQKRLLLLAASCSSLAEAFTSALWNTKVSYDERLDDGTSDIDSLDAFEYCIERDASRYLR